MDLDDDWESVGPAMAEAFADHWGALAIDSLLPSSDDSASEELLAELDDMSEDDTYSNSPGFCFIALDQDLVAGGILCNARLVERADTGRVGSVFVRPAYRRRGIGRALMLTAFAAFWRSGIRRIILDTDADSFTDSPRFYMTFGMRPYRREFLYERVIRPGKELRRLTR
jgi:GNAT superfamily N-acetyltransferase